MNEEIILLGDAKGTKYFLLHDKNVLKTNIGIIHNAFSKTFMNYFDYSRNLWCYTFSDSIISKWENSNEGLRYCIPFALDFWRQIINIPYRIFIDKGEAVKVNTGYASIMNDITGRYHNILPISFPLWSVYTAESSHFPEGIFVGEKMVDQIDKYKFGDKYLAGDFPFYQLLLE